MSYFQCGVRCSARLTWFGPKTWPWMLISRCTHGHPNMRNHDHPGISALLLDIGSHPVSPSSVWRYLTSPSPFFQDLPLFPTVIWRWHSISPPSHTLSLSQSLHRHGWNLMDFRSVANQTKLLPPYSPLLQHAKGHWRPPPTIEIKHRGDLVR